MALAARTVSNILRRCNYASPALSGMGRALATSRAVLAPPPAVAAGDIAEDIDWTEDMPVPVKRRVAALREVQEDYDKLIKQFIKERAELQAKYEQQAAPMMDKRVRLVAGEEKVGAYDIADSDEPDEGIPDFWLTAITNHDLLGEYVTERDAEVLSYLADVRVASLTGEEAGSFKLTFSFRDNPFFTNKVLEKTFYMENPDEIVPDKFVGCSIDWAAGKDTTVSVVKKKVGDKKNKGKGAVTINQTKPCDSFFNFFKTPVVPENPDDLSEEELEALQQQMDEDYEIATALRESLVPRAVEWFTGEAAPPLYGDEFDDGEYGEFEDEEEPEPAPRRR
uniref:Nucleosome assembly protein n=1 Tax=Tetradesmus obliquus TaxID=3088 RepID=A0A383V5W6_TETOB|eukprot:jgi/Sobl393_1/10609/SZX61007.1